MSARSPFGVGAAGIAVLVALAACDPVPDLTFAVSDAGPGKGRGGDIDAPDTCPDAAPPWATTCCDDVACSGNCAAQCSLCITQCDAGLLCCAHTNNVVCRPPGSVCN
ncbi:MAG: hypothetical protein FWD17_19830 [Polyangiaceae bacterium]|nr:hypothetical protein [Polyangiaceae bacterium]